MHRIRTMQKKDIPVAVRLTELEDWHFSAGDFDVMMQLWPGGNFVMVNEDEKILGIGSVLVHGKIAWLSNYIVVKGQRGKGYGKELVAHSLRHISSHGIKDAGLYTYDDRVGFYSQFGFARKGKYTLYAGKVPSEAPSEQTVENVYSVDKKMLADVKRLDKRALGIDRSEFVKSLYRFFPAHFLISRCEYGRIAGYITAGPCPDGSFEVGQWIAKDRETARSLIAALSKNIGSKTLQVIAPDANAGGILKSYGFRTGRKFVKMSLGKGQKAGKKDWLYSLCGMEVW